MLLEANSHCSDILEFRSDILEDPAPGTSQPATTQLSTAAAQARWRSNNPPSLNAQSHLPPGKCMQQTVGDILPGNSAYLD